MAASGPAAVNVALVGLGYWGPNLLRNLATIEGTRVVALCDLDQARAEAFASRHCPQAEITTDCRTIAADPSIDGVVVATPIPTHFPIASLLLAAEKHVLVEKPLAATAGECQQLVDLAARHRRVLMVGHVFEYHPAVRRIKQYIDDGELGRLLYVYSQRVNLGRIQTDLNALWSFAPHDLSILGYWLGEEPTRVAARGFSCLHPGVEDVVFVTLDYPGGVGAHLHLGWLDPRKVRLMTLVGSKKMLVYDDVSLDAKIQIYDKGIERLHSFSEAPASFAEFQYQLRHGDLVVPTVPFIEPLQTECQHFVDCIRSGRTPLTDGHSGGRVVRVLEAAARSLAEDGRPVDLPRPVSVDA